MIDKKKSKTYDGLSIVPFYRRFLPYVVEWLNELDIGKLMNVSNTLTTSQLLDAWKASRADSTRKILIFIYNQIPIGQGFLFDFNDGSCELGWYLSLKYRNMGLGYLSHKLLLSYAFHTFKISSVRVVVVRGNIPSEKVIKKLGYRKMGKNNRGVIYEIDSKIDLGA